jgi:formate hydrogenlyase subunit 4
VTLLAAGLALLLHAALVLGLAPLLAGVMSKVQARLLGRAGRPVLAPYHDLLRGLRKQTVAAEGTTAIAQTAPAIVLSAVIGAALLVPSFTLGMATAPLADLLAVLGLLALARGALLLGALDLGTPFGGLGAARTAMPAALAVPAVVAIAYALTLLTGSSNLDRALAVLREAPTASRVPAAIALGGVVAALGLVALALTGRRATGDADDALRLDYSGADLAMLDYAGSLQLLVWLSLIGGLALPVPLSGGGAPLRAWGIGLLGWMAKTAVLAAGLAAYETTAARMPVGRVPVLLGAAVVLASLCVLLLFAAQAAA